MEQLIPYEQRVVGQDTLPTVDGRALHAFLGIQGDYSSWVKYQIEKGHFIEKRDYIIFMKNHENSGRGRPSQEYFFTFDMAKHIGMMSQTPKGIEIREYFIACEKELRETRPPDEPVHSTLDVLDGMLTELRRHDAMTKEIPVLRQDVDNLMAWRVEETDKQKLRRWHAERDFPGWVKIWVWEQMHGRCMKCRCKLDPKSPHNVPNHPHYDHIRPKNCGGWGFITNCQLLCGRCNQSKGGCKTGYHNHSDYRPPDIIHEAQQIAGDKERQAELKREEQEKQMRFLFEDLGMEPPPGN